jgi:thioredoxin 1
MNIPNKESVWTRKVTESTTQAATAGSYAAKVSIISAVSVIGLNWASITVLKGRPAALTGAEFVAMAAVLAGLVSAGAALVRAWNVRGKNVILLAGAGLLLNGSLLATGFVKAPMLGRQEEKAKKDSSKVIKVQQLSSHSERTIVTQDWTAGFVAELTDHNFDEVINNTDIPVLVDFWAPWCGPCRMMGPVIEKLAKDYEGKAKICRLNVDNSDKVTSRFSINGIPTIILFNGGHLTKKWVGVTDKEVISAAIEREL